MYYCIDKCTTDLSIIYQSSNVLWKPQILVIMVNHTLKYLVRDTRLICLYLRGLHFAFMLWWNRVKLFQLVIVCIPAPTPRERLWIRTCVCDLFPYLLTALYFSLSLYRVRFLESVHSLNFFMCFNRHSILFFDLGKSISILPVALIFLLFFLSCSLSPVNEEFWTELYDLECIVLLCCVGSIVYVLRGQCHLYSMHYAKVRES